MGSNPTRAALFLFSGKKKKLFGLVALPFFLFIGLRISFKKLPWNLKKLVQQIYCHFKCSPKRRERYKEFQHFVDVAPHTLLAASQTRWLSLQMCVSRTVEQWKALKSYFLSAEDDITADTIGEELSSDLNYAYFLFLDTVFPLFARFNVLFQAERPVIHMLQERKK